MNFTIQPGGAGRHLLMAIALGIFLGVGGHLAAATDSSECCEYCMPEYQDCVAWCNGDQGCINQCQTTYNNCAFWCNSCSEWCGGSQGECQQFGCVWPLTCDSGTGCCNWDSK
jgi:hypothetical protein